MELREKIIQAAAQVMRAKGLARTTTKEIARIAGCSEGSLYNHFQSKEDLFLQVLKGILPTFVAALMKLSQRQGIGTVQDNLEDAAIAALAYFHQSLPTSASIFSDPDLLAHHREGLHERNEGPHRANELVAAYLASEQLQGRVRANVNPRAAADLLLGACFQHVFIRQFSAEDESKEAQVAYAKDVISTLMQGLLPGAE